MENKEHLTLDGLQRIINIKATINWGLSDVLREAFPNTIPVKRPLVEVAKILDPNWVAGFVSGESSFMVKIQASQTKLGKAVILIFQITQHSRDKELIESFFSYFGCGKVYIKDELKSVLDFRITKFNDLTNIIIPFFKKYKIIGVKALDFADFCKVAELMKNKAHLTPEGFKEIIRVKEGMNRGNNNYFLISSYSGRSMFDFFI